LVYRTTQQTETRKMELRRRILDVARDLVARWGFGGVQMSAVALDCGIAVGTLYRYFPAKQELFAEVFRAAAQREVDQLASVAASPWPADRRLVRSIWVFTARASRSRRLAYSLIAEPVDPIIETERLNFRRAYDAVFRRIIADGTAAGLFDVADQGVAAAAIVGAMAEALVGPLAPNRGMDAEQTAALAAAMTQFCLRALTGRNHACLDADQQSYDARGG